MLAAPVTRVIIASKNPVKINAVRAAFLKALPHLQLQFVGKFSCCVRSPAGPSYALCPPSW